jgi:hypothetical protein
VVFMIHSFLVLAFGHNSPSLRLDSALTSIKIALVWPVVETDGSINESSG